MFGSGYKHNYKTDLDLATRITEYSFNYTTQDVLM